MTMSIIFYMHNYYNIMQALHVKAFVSLSFFKSIDFHDICTYININPGLIYNLNLKNTVIIRLRATSEASTIFASELCLCWEHRRAYSDKRWLPTHCAI